MFVELPWMSRTPTEGSIMKTLVKDAGLVLVGVSGPHMYPGPKPNRM